MPKVKILPGEMERGKKPEECKSGTVVDRKRVRAGQVVTTSKEKCRLLIALKKAEPASDADKKAIESKDKDKAA